MEQRAVTSQQSARELPANNPAAASLAVINAPTPKAQATTNARSNEPDSPLEAPAAEPAQAAPTRKPIPAISAYLATAARNETLKKAALAPSESL
jgi:hypothetical protein